MKKKHTKLNFNVMKLLVDGFHLNVIFNLKKIKHILGTKIIKRTQRKTSFTCLKNNGLCPVVISISAK